MPTIASLVNAEDGGLAFVSDGGRGVRDEWLRMTCAGSPHLVDEVIRSALSAVTVPPARAHSGIALLRGHLARAAEVSSPDWSCAHTEGSVASTEVPA